MNMWMIIFAIVWIICGILSYGLWFAYFQNEYMFIAKENYDNDKKLAFVLSFFGIVSLVILLCMGADKHGLQYK